MPVRFISYPARSARVSTQDEFGLPTRVAFVPHTRATSCQQIWRDCRRHAIPIFLAVQSTPLAAATSLPTNNIIAARNASASTHCGMPPTAWANRPCQTSRNHPFEAHSWRRMSCNHSPGITPLGNSIQSPINHMAGADAVQARQPARKRLQSLHVSPPRAHPPQRENAVGLGQPGRKMLAVRASPLPGVSGPANNSPTASVLTVSADQAPTAFTNNLLVRIQDPALAQKSDTMLCGQQSPTLINQAAL